MFSPKFEDILETELVAQNICYNVNFQIIVNTIKNLGGIKEVSRTNLTFLQYNSFKKSNFSKNILK